MLFRKLVCSCTLAATLLLLSVDANAQERNRLILGLTYPEGPTISVKFAGTTRLPGASGEAKVERKRGMTEIEIELDEMKPASLFAGDYNTYVLWVVSPEGQVDNLGEFVLRGNRSKLNVSTPLSTFGMLVTAEPHFLVDHPSRFVVLENSRPTNRSGLTQIAELNYSGFEGVYNFERESLVGLPESKGEVRTDLEAAQTSIELAKRAGAQEFAPEELALAEQELEIAQHLPADSFQNRMLAGHKVIRLAVEAQKLAEQRSYESALAAERKRNADQISSLESGIVAAQTQAERARLEAEQKALQLKMEEEARASAQLSADRAAREAAEARRRADEEARQRRLAEEAASEARGRADDAARRAQEAQAERDRAREELKDALSAVVNIRETAKGLILDLPNILFDFDRAELKPQAREILAKISGVLLIARDYSLRVEGHTDNVGDPEYNLRLSEERARSVYAYLRGAGIEHSRLSYTGLGETAPIGSNESAEGRQRNRRVEIHVEETTSRIETGS